MRRLVAVLVLLLLCAGGTSYAQQPLTPEETFPTSLHATRPGKQHFYAQQRGGFEQLTGVPMSDLPCTACHAPTKADGTPIDNATYKPDCTDCHKQEGDKVADSVCLGCHQRQGLEKTRFPDDVHAAAGFTCITCHTEREMHGDGTSYVSQLQQGAMDAKCQNCHQGMPTNIAAHDGVHLSSLDCNACHAQSVITCNDCHFDSQVAGGGRRYYAPAASGFTYLVRREGSGKIHTATMQTLVYKDKSFVVIAPYTAHSIAKKARTCADCHDNANLRAYSASGKMAITRWDASANKLKTIGGVVPVPPDWQTAFTFDHVTYTGDPASPVTDPNAWAFAKSGNDLQQMLFAEPLTAEQIKKLETPEPSVAEQVLSPFKSTGGGCTVGGDGSADPTLPALLVAALSLLALRRRKPG
ncbi:MAG TPA: JDVT-CTERM domain-containing protein [Ramlibacter sp.]|nr:JDVT-CTERM domain-containing protein [Ramlibacter sp.]